MNARSSFPKVKLRPWARQTRQTTEASRFSLFLKPHVFNSIAWYICNNYICIYNIWLLGLSKFARGLAKLNYGPVWHNIILKNITENMFKHIFYIYSKICYLYCVGERFRSVVPLRNSCGSIRDPFGNRCRRCRFAWFAQCLYQCQCLILFEIAVWIIGGQLLR